MSGVLCNLTNGFFKGTPYDIHASGFVIVQFEFFQDRDAAQISGSAPRHDAFFDSCARGVHGILNASFFLLQLHLGGRAYLDYSHSSNKLSQALLQLFLIVVRRGFFGLHAKLLDASLDLAGSTSAADDCSVVFIDDHLLGATEVLQVQILNL